MEQTIMPSYEEMPDDNEDLAKVQVSFPHLPDNREESCPIPVSEIMDYLAAEVPDGELLEPGGLHFIRTAQVAERAFWIWWFTDPSGARCYVTVDLSPEGEAAVGYDEDYYGLTPEQFMLGTRHQVF